MKDVTTLDWFAAHVLTTIRGGLPCDDEEQAGLAAACYSMAEKMIEEKKKRESAVDAK